MNALTAIPSIPAIIVNDIQTQDSPCKVRQVRTWVRYFARMIDVLLFSLLIGLTLGIFAPSVLDVPSTLLGIAILFAWIFQESILLANCGTTPGKWLFKIKVRNGKGQKLTFSEALNRSFSVWLKGMGAGVPLLNLITLLSSRGKLKHDGITAWDEEGGFVVTHGKVGVLRSVVVILLLIGFVFLNAWGNMIEEQEAYEFASNSIENQELLTGTEENVTANAEYSRPNIEHQELSSTDFDRLVLQAEKWLED